MNENAKKKNPLTGKGKERVTVKWEDGSSYEGDLLDGKFHGQGSMYGRMVTSFQGHGKTAKKTAMVVSQDLTDLFLSDSSMMMFLMERVFTLDRMEQLFREIGKMVSKMDTEFCGITKRVSFTMVLGKMVPLVHFTSQFRKFSRYSSEKYQ